MEGVSMEAIKRKYIVDDNNKKIAVQLDIKTFRKIEEIMEDYALYNMMRENVKDEKLNLQEAENYYSQLEKPN